MNNYAGLQSVGSYSRPPIHRKARWFYRWSGKLYRMAMKPRAQWQDFDPRITSIECPECGAAMIRGNVHPFNYFHCGMCGNIEDEL